MLPLKAEGNTLNWEAQGSVASAILAWHSALAWFYKVAKDGERKDTALRLTCLPTVMWGLRPEENLTAWDCPHSSEKFTLLTQSMPHSQPTFGMLTLEWSITEYPTLHGLLRKLCKTLNWTENKIEHKINKTTTFLNPLHTDKRAWTHWHKLRPCEGASGCLLKEKIGNHSIRPHVVLLNFTRLPKNWCQCFSNKSTKQTRKEHHQTLYEVSIALIHKPHKRTGKNKQTKNNNKKKTSHKPIILIKVGEELLNQILTN